MMTGVTLMNKLIGHPEEKNIHDLTEKDQYLLTEVVIWREGEKEALIEGMDIVVIGIRIRAHQLVPTTHHIVSGMNQHVTSTNHLIIGTDQIVNGTFHEQATMKDGRNMKMVDTDQD